ncbi:transposable element Tcb1 transposase [Trichonephila clavipes]|nr:transposable element Tcb1 transposase [Trichonephila clavipes]
MSPRKQRSAFVQVSEFYRRRIVAYRDCGLSFRKIGSHVERNQTTVMRICNRWIKECLFVPFDAVYSRVVCPQDIHCLVYHTDISANNGVMKKDRHRGEQMLYRCVMHRRNGPAPGVMELGGIGYHSRIPLVRISGTLNSQPYISEVLEPVVIPYFRGLATSIFQQVNARPHVARIVQRFFVYHQIELLPWPARSSNLSPIENMWSMFAQRLTQITPPAFTPDYFW